MRGSSCAVLQLSVLQLSVIVVIGCAPEQPGARRARDAGAVSRVDASPASDARVATTCTLDPALCPAGERCSVTGVCLSEGRCAADGDCASGERCGMASRVCLDAATGACAAPGDCPEGQTCAAEGVCAIGGACGSAEIAIENVAPNVMILLDRSGSMDRTIDGRTRWDIAKEAIFTILDRFHTRVRFGLATYSACLRGGCSAGSVVVPIADRNRMPIRSFLRPLRGIGSETGAAPDYLCETDFPETSTGVSLAALVGEPSLQDALRSNAVLVITDGRESDDCAARVSGPTGARRLFRQAVPVRTYPVGFSADTSAAEMREIAAEGGGTGFYRADDAAALVDALERIASEVVSCDYVLASAPPDPDELHVFFDDDPAGVPGDGVGWSYDASTQVLRFHGSACDALRAGTVADVDVVYGCPEPVLE